MDVNSTNSDLDRPLQAKVPVIHLDFQYRQVDILLFSSYAIACIYALWACTMHYKLPYRQSGTVLFYFQMALTSFIRTIWFASPLGVHSVTYKPARVEFGQVGWDKALLTESVDMIGNLCMYSIFILLVVYWAHMLRRLIMHESIRLYPFRYFAAIMASFLCLAIVGIVLFLTDQLDSYGLLIFDHVVICILSFLCLAAILMYSYRMKAVFQAFLEINQIDTTDRMRAVTWVTNISILFLLCNAVLTCYSLVDVAVPYSPVGVLFPAKWWWLLVAYKHLLELSVLYALLYSLWGVNAKDFHDRGKYEALPDYSDDEIATLAVNSTGSNGLIGPYVNTNPCIPTAYPLHVQRPGTK